MREKTAPGRLASPLRNSSEQIIAFAFVATSSQCSLLFCFFAAADSLRTGCVQFGERGFSAR